MLYFQIGYSTVQLGPMTTFVPSCSNHHSWGNNENDKLKQNDEDDTDRLLIKTTEKWNYINLI